MAINTTNSNFVNINSLPQTQEAMDGDLLIIQTENGTQTIDFTNLNVVKTDAAGNATIVGNLTGNNAKFETLTASVVGGSSFSANSKEGFTAVQGYYNFFTVEAGIVTSAVQTTPSPEYTNLTSTFLPAMTSWQNSVYKRIVDYNSYITVLAGETYATVSIPNFYVTYPDVGDTDLKMWHVIIFCNNPLLYNNTTSPISGLPYASAEDSAVNTTLTKDGSNLNFRLNTGVKVPQNTAFYYRILYTY